MKWTSELAGGPLITHLYSPGSNPRAPLCALVGNLNRTVPSREAPAQASSLSTHHEERVECADQPTEVAGVVFRLEFFER